MKILSTHPYGRNSASVLQYASDPRPGELLGFLDYWRNHTAVKSMSLVDRADDRVLFRVSLKSNIGWVTQAVLENNGFFSSSVPVSQGTEAWQVFMEEENKSSLLSQLDQVGTVKVDQISRLEIDKNGRIAPTSSLASLTPRQSEILRVAMESGYFDTPRRVDSRKLARGMGIAQSTLLEHLRKAQTKILRQALATQSAN